MNITIEMCLIVCPMVFLAGFVDAMAGGGGLISLPAYLFAGLPAHTAVATNKLSSSVGTVISTVRICKKKHMDVPLAVPSIAAALIGSWLGAHVALMVSDRILKMVMLFLLPVIAYYVLRKKNLDDSQNNSLSRTGQYIIATAASLFVGLYDGFYGPGTGTFLILIYTGLVKMDVLTAAGNTKLVNLSSNLSALLVFLTNGVVLLPLGIIASIFSIAGHYIGAGLVLKNGSKIVRVIILFVVALLFCKILAEWFF